MNVLKNEKGFTLIELVLIIVILGILSAVAIVQFGTLSVDARDSAIDGGYGSYQSALAIAVGTCRSFPDVADGAGDCNSATPDFAGDFTTTVYNKVTVGGDLSADFTAGLLTICSGTIAGSGRMASATYTVVGGVGNLTVLGAKVAAAAPCPA